MHFYGEPFTEVLEASLHLLEGQQQSPNFSPGERPENNRHAVMTCKHRQRYGARHFLIYGASQILNRALI